MISDRRAFIESQPAVLTPAHSHLLVQKATSKLLF
jgi:hypothetical protein